MNYFLDIPGLKRLWSYIEDLHNDVAADDEIIDLFAAADMMPVVTDEDGNIMTDENGAILLV